MSTASADTDTGEFHWPEDPLISVQTLATWQQKGRKLAIFDASWHLPDLHRNARSEFEDAHIPNAGFFDIDALSDQSSPLPHMMQKRDDFATSLGNLGITADTPIVFYDNSQVRSSCRAWWMVKSLGHEHVYVLDGGMTSWRKATMPVRAGDIPQWAPKAYQPKDPQPYFIAADDIDTSQQLVLDARSAGRFEGTEAEKRPGIRAGHIPGSFNRHYAAMFDRTGLFLPKAELARFLGSRGNRPVVTTCGSGITASILAFTLYRIGRKDVKVYDGSWTEWGNLDPDISGGEPRPIETGPARERRQ